LQWLTTLEKATKWLLQLV